MEWRYSWRRTHGLTLRDALEDHGRWLFRYRGHLPLLLLPVFVAALADRHGAADHLGTAWELLCLATAFAGLTVRVLTVAFVPAGTSGRNTATQVAAVLNTTGMYSIVRHPLYLGNAIVLVGIGAVPGSWWLIAVLLLAFGLYYERIMLAEEAFLREQFGAAFTTWAARVPGIVPDPRLWQAPALRFSWRTALRREYHGAVAILAAFAVLRALADLGMHRPPLDGLTIGYVVVAGLLFVVCRFLKKRTRLLRVAGR